MVWLSDFWHYWRWNLLAGLLAAVVAHLLEIGYYYLNLAFITRNIEALPFHYKIALGFGQGAWWSFLLSFATGVIVALSFNIRSRY